MKWQYTEGWVLIMISEKKEKSILLLSFAAGASFAVAELIFSIYSHSQSALMDAVYDASELIFIALLLFLTPLFHKPISEKHPYGYFQVESVFLIIKGFMLIAVTMSVSTQVVETALSGGNLVSGSQVSAFQFALGLVSVIVFLVMKRMNRRVSSPTVDAELLGWKLDIAYSFGLAAAYFGSIFLGKTRLAFLAPYFDPVVAVLVMLFMLPESIRMLWGAIKDVFLFSPDEQTTEQIKEICNGVLIENDFQPDFYDITRTGRRIWISVYFRISGESLMVKKLEQVSSAVNTRLDDAFENCTCELILLP